MRRILVLSIVWLLPAGALAVAGAQSMADPATTADTIVVLPADESSEAETLGEFQHQSPDGQLLHDYRDQRVVAVEHDAQAEISAVLAEINKLDSQQDEPTLQREIERIKLDAEITRLKIMIEDAENQGDHDRADALWEEIERLVTLDEPAVGVPQAQPAR